MVFNGLRNRIFIILASSTIAISSLFYFADNIQATDKAKIYICNCPGGCLCEYETKKPGGRCVCGLATIPSDREPNEDLEYECACGGDCDCGSRADEDGLCHCGIKDMKEK